MRSGHTPFMRLGVRIKWVGEFFGNFPTGH